MALIDGIANAFVSGFNNRANRRTQERINAENIAFQREVNKQNIDQQWKMWEATNDYNHPAAQMARYNEAGLNPNLIYGQTNTTAPVNVGNAEATKQDAYMRKSSRIDLPGLGDFLAVLSQKESIERQVLENEYLARTLEDRVSSKKFEVDRIAKEIDLMESNIQKNGAQTESINLNNEIDRFYKENIQPLEKDLMQNKVTLSDNDVRNIEYRNRILDAQTQIAEFDIQLQTLEYFIKEGQVSLNEDQRKQIQQNIEESKKRIEEMNAKINESGYRQEGMYYDNLKKEVDSYNIFSDIKMLDGIGTFFSKPLTSFKRGVQSTINKLKK